MTRHYIIIMSYLHEDVSSSRYNFSYKMCIDKYSIETYTNTRMICIQNINLCKEIEHLTIFCPEVLEL